VTPQLSAALLGFRVDIACRRPLPIADSELHRQVDSRVSRRVNEDLILGSRCDDVGADEVGDQAGFRVVDGHRRGLRGVAILGEQFSLELFVVGNCVVEAIWTSYSGGFARASPHARMQYIWAAARIAASAHLSVVHAETHAGSVSGSSVTTAANSASYWVWGLEGGTVKVA